MFTQGERAEQEGHPGQHTRGLNVEVGWVGICRELLRGGAGVSGLGCLVGRVSG